MDPHEKPDMKASPAASSMIELANGSGETPTMSDEAWADLDRKTVLRLDLLLVPLVAMLYLLSFLDRANIGNARVAGLQADLGITDHQYQTAITITYVPYIAAELPSNLLLKKIGPKIVLPTICVCWGLITTLQSQIHNYAGLLACRFFLGLAEGGLYPGIILYLSGFYRRHELQVRVGLFFSAVALSGAFSGLLAAAIQQMDGIRGLRGWQWIFLLEGLFTVLFGFVVFLTLPNDPHTVRTFSPEQAAHCVRRLKLDVNMQADEKVTIKTVGSVFKDVHVWVASINLFCNGACLFGLAYFTPSIVQGLGYSRTRTQLLTVPPFACAFVVTMIAAYLADRFKRRGLTAICTTSIALIGAAMAFTLRSIHGRYAALILLITGIYSTSPSLISWVPNNSAGHVRRATAIAFAVMLCNVGGIVSTWIYPGSSAPYYLFGAKFNLSLIAITIAGCGFQVFWLSRLNKLKNERASEILRDVADLSFEEQFAKLGDHHPDFKYTY